MVEDIPVAAATEDRPRASRATPDPRLAHIAEIIRSHLRNSEISRDPACWQFLQSQLGLIAEGILKEL